MERFGEFYKNFVSTLVVESLDGIIDELASSVVFSHFGRDAIERRFEWYKKNGIAPTEKVSKIASKSKAARVNADGSDESKIATVPLDERDYQQVLPYIFKYVDKDVRDELEKVYKDNPKKMQKFKKNYKDVTVRDVKEDASQVKGILTNWLALRHDKGSGVPKSLLEKIDFADLRDSVDKAYKKLTGATASTDSTGGVDDDMPQGFSFVKETGDFRLYKWSALGDVCSLDSKVKANWMAIAIDIAGTVTENWCVAAKDYAEQYGEPDGDGTFKYPYYLLRKKTDNGYVPYVLMHGNSLQCKNGADAGITQTMADEIKPAIEEHIKTIVMG